MALRSRVLHARNDDDALTRCQQLTNVSKQTTQSSDVLRTSYVDIRRRLRSADTAMLAVPATKCSMLSDRDFPVASARARNSLPSSVRNAPSLTTFRRELKTVFFQSSFDND